MKTMKKILCSTLALVGVCAFSGGLAFAASADTTIQIEGNAFEMQYGASVRTAEPAGIRFTALVGKDVYNEVSSDPNKDFGMFIVPDSYMEDYETYIASNPNYEGKYYEYFSEQKKMIDFTYTPDQLTEKDGGYLMRGALSNVLFENLTREFVGVAYIKTTTGNDIFYEYAEFDRVDNARSISYVASAAINAGEGSEALDSYLAKSAYKLMGVTYNKETEEYVYGVNAYDALEDIEAISPESVYALPSQALALTVGNAASVTSQNLSCLSVEYKSDREDIVSVNDKGVVTALKEGTATITATAGNYISTRKVNVVSDYYEFDATEFVDTKSVAAYSSVSGLKYGKTDTYAFTGNSWNSEINALNTTHAGDYAIYEDPKAVRENLNGKGYKYIAMNFALSTGASIRVVGSSIYGTLGMTFTDGSALAYAGTVAATTQAPYFHVYKNGAEVMVGDTIEDSVWYTVVVELLLDPTGSSKGNIEDEWSTVGFGVGNNKAVYIAGGRYYTNESFKDDYIYDYVEYGADEFVDTKNGAGGYAAVDGRVFGRSNVYKFASTTAWTYEIGALHTVHASTAKDRIYQESWQVAENATAHGWQYIAIDFALGANDTMQLVNTIPNGTGTTTGGLVLKDGAVPTYRTALIDTAEEKGWYKIYSEGKEIAIGGTEALADGVWYTVVVKLLMGTELTGQYRNIGFGAAAGNIYISGVRYYVNDNFKTEYTTLEDYYEYGAEEVIDVKKNGSYSVASEEIYGKENVYMFTGNGWNNQIDVRKTTHIGYSAGSGAFYSQAKDVRDSLIAKGIQYVSIEFALAPGAAVSLLGIIPYTGSNNNENGGLNFAAGSALAYRPTVDTPEEETYFTVYANGEEVAIGDTIEDGVWYTVVVKLQLDVNKAQAIASYVNVGFGATGKGLTYISGVRYYTNDSYKTDYAAYSEGESEENFPPEESEVVEYTAYFFDAERGSDYNDGLSLDAPKATVSAAMEIAATASPNNPVKLLFKKGSTFIGKAIFEGYEATKDFPLILDAYGDGEGYPKFVGTGSETTKNAIDAVLYFKNDNVWVMNLEVTGPTAYQGIAFQPVSGGAFENIRIEGNYVHDINFNWTYSTAPAETNPDDIDVELVCPVGDNADGRYTYRKYAAICLDNDYTGAPVWFEDVWIVNNRVENVGKIGINVYNRWNNKGGVGYGYNHYVDGTENYNDPSKNLGNYPNKNVYVVGNNLSCCGGDGLVISGVKGGAIENNVSYYANYLGREGYYNASIWVFASEDVLFQYNEAAYTYMRNGGQDAQGFDIDNACRNIIFRYNYAHHNEGGGLLLCDNTTSIDKYDVNGNLIQSGASVSGNWGDNYIYGNVFAYNGIVNDPERSAFITVSRKVSNVYIFNNTIVMSGEIKGQNIVNVEQDGCSYHYYYNNVFYSEKNSSAKFDLFGEFTCYFNGNLFYNVSTNGLFLTNQNARTYDPKMTGLDGRETSDFNGFDALSFFVPQESKVWTDGVNLPEKALEAKLNEDALGNKTGNVHLGALVG